MAEGMCGAVAKFSYKDFTEKKMLGEGSFNQVYVATHPSVGRCVLKIVSRSFHGKEKQKKKLEVEAKEIFSITHERLIKGIGVVIEPEHLCLVYEYAEYGSLTDAIRRKIPIDWPLHIRIAYQTTLALSYLHNRPEPLFHGNLKTSNVLLTKDFHAKVSDFVYPRRATWMTQATHQKDITDRRRMANGEPVVRKGSLLAHIPPETVRNIHVKPNAPYDIYSFAVMLWEMMTKKHPFPDESTNEVFEKLSNGYVLPYEDISPSRPDIFFDIMDKAFHSQPESRPQLSEIHSKLEEAFLNSEQQAISAAIECQQAYERYRVIKRETQAEKEKEAARVKAANRSVTDRLINQDRTFVDSTAPPPTEEKPSTSGQIFNTSAHVSSSKPSTNQRSKPRVPSVYTKTTSVSMQPADDDEEDFVAEYPPNIPVNPPRQAFHSQSSSSSMTPSEETKPSSYFEESGKPQENQAFPIPQSEIQHMSVSHGGGPQPTIVNTHIHAENVQLQVGDSNMIAQPGQPFSPTQDMPPSEIGSATIPARHSQRIMVRKDIYVVCDNVGNEWRRLARFMGFSKAGIETIDHDFTRDGLVEKAYQAISRWEAYHCGKVTIQQLVKVLEEANLVHIALKLNP